MLYFNVVSKWQWEKQIGVMDAKKRNPSMQSNNFDPQNVVSIENNAFLFIYVNYLGGNGNLWSNIRFWILIQSAFVSSVLMSNWWWIHHNFLKPFPFVFLSIAFFASILGMVIDIVYIMHTHTHA